MISYVPRLCFLLQILFSFCLITVLLNTISLNALNSVGIFIPFALIDSLPSSEKIECNFDFNPPNLLIGIPLCLTLILPAIFYFEYHRTLSLLKSC